MNKYIILLSLIFLLGMSGGIINQEYPRTPLKNLTAFLFVGDSNVYYNNTNACTLVPHVNIGVSGSKIENQTSYITAYYASHGYTNSNSPYRKLLLMVGTNNFGANDSATTAAAKYITLIGEQNKNFDKIYCLSAIPINHSQYYETYGAQLHYLYEPYSKVRDFNNMLKNICPNYIDIISLVTIYDSNNVNYGELNANYTRNGDGIHLNDAAWSMVFERINNYLYYR